MASLYWIYQTPPNGPKDQPHRVIPDGQDGNLSEDDLKRLQERFGENFAGTIEATDIQVARKQLACPACDAVREVMGQIMREIGH